MTDVAGRVLSVDEYIVGSIVVTAASIGESTLTLETVEPFSDEGGTVLIETDTADIEIAYTTVDDDTDVMTLASTLPAAVAVDDRVRVHPKAMERHAVVAPQDGEGAPIIALVPHHMIPWLRAGIRDDEDQEACIVRETDPGEWVVDNVLGVQYADMTYRSVDWSNEHGLNLMGGDIGSDTASSLFGLAVESVELFAENKGPVDINIPHFTGVVRKIGEGGIDTDGVLVTIDRPVKITCEAYASVENTDSTGYNARMYVLFVEPSTSEQFRGRQATNWCPATDTGHHRQVFKSRQVYFNASPDAPRSFRVYWGFQQDSGSGKTATIRNMGMTIRVSYAPGVPTDTEPDREPQWGPVTLRERYLIEEIDDDGTD